MVETSIEDIPHFSLSPIKSGSFTDGRHISVPYKALATSLLCGSSWAPGWPLGFSHYGSDEDVFWAVNHHFNTCTQISDVRGYGRFG